jgi:hypothetical protein
MRRLSGQREEQNRCSIMGALARAERRIEKITFSCELAFSRIISKGNFSTRCVAVIGTDSRLAAA